MKKASILPLSLIFFLIISFISLFYLRLSSHTPRFSRDLANYTQAQILLNNAEELSKYLLFSAREQGKECLEQIHFNYPNKDDIVQIEYFYPLQTCKDFKLTQTNLDANLSQDNIIVVNFSVLLGANTLNEKGVNDEIFTQKTLYLYPNF